MFSTTRGKGFHIQFSNGWTVSVQFGPGNYGDNYDEDISPQGNIESGARGSTRAEAACFHRGERLHPLANGDTVEGYMTTEAVWEFMQRVHDLPDTPNVPPVTVSRYGSAEDAN